MRHGTNNFTENNFIRIAWGLNPRGWFSAEKKYSTLDTNDCASRNESLHIR